VTAKLIVLIMAAVYRAAVDGDRMTGTIDFGLYGKATFTGHRGRRPQAASNAAIEGSARDAGIGAASAGDLFGVPRNGVLLPEMIGIPAGRFPVTNAQYRAFTDATQREPPLSPMGWGDYATNGRPGGTARASG